MKKLLLAVATLVIMVVAASAREARERTDKNELSRNVAIFNSIVKELQANYVDTIDAKKTIRTAIDAMLSGIDPYTEYFSDDEREQLTTISSGQYGGIGAYIMKRDKGTIVNQLVWDAPAYIAGLRPGDRFLSINDELVAEMNYDEVSKRLRGQPGSKLTVKVQRPYVSDSILTFELTRKSISVNPLPYYGVDSTGVGYISLTTFNEKSAAAVRNAIVEMQNSGRLKALILDLRANGGGLLESSVQIVGLFVPKGTEVVRTRGFDNRNEKIYKTTQKPIDADLPLAVLIDGATASSSEIVAGALQDLDRAVIIGDRSYGKGLVQTSRPLPYDGLLKITVARYYIPSGRLIQAIDYSHRNPDGSVARIPDSLTKIWYTAAGREVRDGGGITPDVNVVDTTMNRLLYNVISDFWAFDYANRFASLTPTIPDADNWVVGDSIFNDFKAFIDPDRFKYDRMSDMAIKYLRDAARTEGYDNDSVKAQIDILAGMMRHDLEHDLNFNRDELIQILDAEISERYYDESDRVKRSLRYDIVADSAHVILLNKDRYSKILHTAEQ